MKPISRAAARTHDVWVWGILALLAILIAWERLHTLHEPFERDITTYAVIGHELLAGRPLYSDLWDHKPPGIHWTYALAEILAGYGDGAIYLLNLLASLATLLGLYRAGKVVAGKGGVLWAAGFWAVASGDLYLEANQPNTEVFLNACLTWAFALWLEVEFRRWSLGRTLGIGALFALGSLYKPVLFFPLLFWISFELFKLREDGRKDPKAFRRIWMVSAFSMAGWFFLMVWFCFRGALGDLTEALFSYNAFVFSQWPWSWSGSFLSLWPSFLWFATPLLGISILGWCFLRGESPKAWKLWAAWALATVLEIFQQGNFFHHYYQLWLPVLCLGAAWGVVGFGIRFGKNSRIKDQAWALGLMVLLLLNEVPLYFLSAEQWSRLKYGNVFIDSRELAGKIETLLKPGETFYEWGNETGLYFWTQRRPPSGVFYAYPLASGPLKESLTKRVPAQLEESRPELFIFNSDFYGPTADNPILLDWFKQRYERIPGKAQQGPYLLMMRKGGELSKRFQPS